MNIWLINHYAVPPHYYPLARQTYFAKNLIKMGHSVKIFAASSVHNSSLNLITNGQLWREETVDGINYVYVKCCDYHGNGMKRIFNMCEFAWKLPKVCRRFNKPDAIVATSMPPMSCAMGIRLAHKYKCKGVAEIADLWPESIVAYGIAGKYNLAVLLLRRLEKWIYKKSSAIVFTMEGGYDYIVERGWHKDIQREKVFHINNGIDLETFRYNKTVYHLEDKDLDDSRTFKVIYVGSIRRVNRLSVLVETARELKMRGADTIKLLIYGDGSEREKLMQKVTALDLDNIIFKGRIDKKYIPYVLSKGNLNLLHWAYTPIMRFGASPNKLFDYLASGKLILSDINMKYDLIKKYNAGIVIESQDPEVIANVINQAASNPSETFSDKCKHAQKAAHDHDFEVLTNELLDVLEVCKI